MVATKLYRLVCATLLAIAGLVLGSTVWAGEKEEIRPYSEKRLKVLISKDLLDSETTQLLLEARNGDLSEVQTRALYASLDDLYETATRNSRGNSSWSWGKKMAAAILGGFSALVVFAAWKGHNEPKVIGPNEDNRDGHDPLRMHPDYILNHSEPEEFRNMTNQAIVNELQSYIDEPPGINYKLYTRKDLVQRIKERRELTASHDRIMKMSEDGRLDKLAESLRARGELPPPMPPRVVVEENPNTMTEAEKQESLRKAAENLMFNDQPAENTLYAKLATITGNTMQDQAEKARVLKELVSMAAERVEVLERRDNKLHQQPEKPPEPITQAQIAAMEKTMEDPEFDKWEYRG